MSGAVDKRPVLWVMMDTIATSVLSIATMLIIARLAGPSDFVKAALIVGAVMFANLYVEVLFHDALIQNLDITDREFEQAFSVSLLIATAIIGIVLFIAFSIRGGAYSQIGSLSVVASFYLLFSGPTGVANARQRRKMEYRDVARASVFGRTAGCAIGVATALSGHGTLGLILQNTSGALVQALLIFLFTGWRPKFRVSFDGKLKELLRFALPNSFTYSLVAARIQAYGLFVASLMGLTIAGYINIAFRLTTTPQLILFAALGNLCFPMIASQQLSKPGRDAAYFKATKIISTATLPLFIGLALTATDVVPLVLGESWLPSIPLVVVLSIGCAVYFSRLSSSFFLRAMGTVKYSLWNACFQLLLTIGGLLVVRPDEALTAVYFWLLPLVIQVPATWLVMSKVAKIGISDQLKVLMPSAVASIAMTGAVVFVQVETAAWSHGMRILLSLAIGGIVYLMTVFAIDKEMRRLLFAGRALQRFGTFGL